MPGKKKARQKALSDAYHVEYTPRGFAVIKGVILEGASFRCEVCDKVKPAAEFGLTFRAGIVKNQPWCRTCQGEA